MWAKVAASVKTCSESPGHSDATSQVPVSIQGPAAHGAPDLIHEARAERRRERAVGGGDADESRACGVDAVGSRERERKAGERRPAPADRRAAAVRADGPLDGARTPLTTVRRRPRRGRRASRPGASRRRDAAPSGRARRTASRQPCARSADAATKTPARPVRGSRANEIRSIDAKPSSSAGGSSSRSTRIWDVGAISAGLVARGHLQLLGRRERAEPLEEPHRPC